MRDELKKTKKMNYVPPMIKVNQLTMEYSIAAGSAVVNPSQPDVTDWDDKGTVGDGISEF